MKKLIILSLSLFLAGCFGNSVPSDSVQCPPRPTSKVAVNSDLVEEHQTLQEMYDICAGYRK